MATKTPRFVIKPSLLAILLAFPAQQALAANCNWIPASGNWNVAGNWDCGLVPSAPNADTANIVASRTVTVNDVRSIRSLNNAGTVQLDAFLLDLQGGGTGTANSGTINVGGASTAALQVGAGHNINNTGGTINIANGSFVNQFGSTITGGTINTSGSGALTVFSSSANFLNNSTLNGRMDMASNANSRQRVSGALTLGGASTTIDINQNGILSLEGNSSLAGAGNLVFGDTGGGNRIDLDGNGTTTFAAGVTVHGQNGTIGQQLNIPGTQTLVNNGTISADVASGTISITDSDVTNNGTLSALNGGTLVLNSNVTGGASGQIVAGSGSTVRQQGVTLSGNINTSGSGLFTVTSTAANRLTGVTFVGNLDMATEANSRQRVTTGGLVLNGTVNINNNGILSFEGDGTLGGNGTVVLGATGGGNRIDLDGNGTTTIASGITVRGQNGTIGQQINIPGTQTLVNNGLISADVAGGTITIDQSAVVNNNRLEARNGATLQLGSDVSNGGSGVILADNGVVLQSGMRISGGDIQSANGGALRVSSTAANYVDAATVSGVMDMSTVGNSRQRVNNGLTVNGTVNINQNGILSFEGTGTLSGTGSIVVGSTGAGNRIDLDGNGTTTFAAGVTVRGHSGTIGQQLNIGGTQTLVNNGSIIADGAGGTIAFTDSALVNNGIVRAQAGTMNVGVALSGTGTLQVDSGGTMNLANGAKTQGTLLMGVAGAALNLGTGNLTINTDYTNAGAGSGNAFNRRASVSGSGQIVAGGDVKQVITGAGVSNGNTDNATLTIGNMRVGANTFNYQIGNSGSTGPTLRGAVQTAANGGNINDARLSGSGVTAANYNAGGPAANSGDLAVVFNAASAGALAPLAGQVLNLRSNFENIADQKLNIVLAGGAAAYNAAVGATTPTPIVVGNQRVGGGNLAGLLVANTAAPGAFSEDLRASFGASGGAALNNGAVATGIVAGGNSAGVMGVGVNTATAGAKSGTVQINYETLGTVGGVSNNLGVAGANPAQTINVSGNVYQLAAGALQTGPLNFGTLQVGQQVSQNLVVRNTASGATGFVEDLNAAFGASGNSQISGSGTLNGILAGTNSTAANGAMTVTVTGATAGGLNSSIAVNYFSAGAVNSVSNGLGAVALGSENFAVNGTITATGSVINQANPQINNPTINLAARRVGDAAATANVSVTNVAGAPPQAALNASISSGGAPVTASGSFNLLDPGATSTALQVGLTTAVAGNYTGANAGSATIALVSDASNVGNCAPNCQLNLAPQTVSVSGKVYTAAAGQSTTPEVNFGIVRVGDSVAGRNVAVHNAAAVSGLNDTLHASLNGVSGPFAAGAAASGIVAQGNGQIAVGLATTTAGVFSQNASVAFISQNPDMADISAGADASVLLKAQVNNIANAALAKFSGLGTLSVIGDDYTLDLGNVVLGTLGISGSLQLANAISGPADFLSGTFDLSATGDADGFSFTGWDPFSGLAAGQSIGGLDYVFDATTLGVLDDLIRLDALSQNGSGPDLGQQRTLRIVANVIDQQGGGGTVPEPATMMLLTIALASLLLQRRRSMVH
ncbi:choice-of-anchor D domain-containing protein [Accumulibacter sp.]|uniref:choice-of-anchor D domain-containing protein n=1 Tax=Accumulibacter sp. TaxID=2053492 RepID=UPI001AC2C1A0|nr:choice-of-anchor D domain-containing protein [Accumulibacter sp.]MBN8454256.1 choice-of-anchor D domain-containing protein [Accumulibacter sp.]